MLWWCCSVCRLHSSVATVSSVWSHARSHFLPTLSSVWLLLAPSCLFDRDCQRPAMAPAASRLSICEAASSSQASGLCRAGSRLFDEQNLCCSSDVRCPAFVDGDVALCLELHLLTVPTTYSCVPRTCAIITRPASWPCHASLHFRLRAGKALAPCMHKHRVTTKQPAICSTCHHLQHVLLCRFQNTPRACGCTSTALSTRCMHPWRSWTQARGCLFITSTSAVQVVAASTSFQCTTSFTLIGASREAVRIVVGLLAAWAAPHLMSGCTTLHCMSSASDRNLRYINTRLLRPCAGMAMGRERAVLCCGIAA